MWAPNLPISQFCKMRIKLPDRVIMKIKCELFLKGTKQITVSHGCYFPIITHISHSHLEAPSSSAVEVAEQIQP